MTRASRNIGLRTFYDPLNPPDPRANPSTNRPEIPGSSTNFVRPEVPLPVYEPGGGEVALSGQRGGAEITTPLAPWDNAMPGPNSGPGGIGGDFRYPTQQVDERLLPAPAAAPAGRPGGLGTVLSRAVVPAASRAAPAATAAAPAAAPQSSLFTGIDRQNSGPNDRFRGGGTALDLSGLLGGLFGGRGAAPSPAPPPPPARGAAAPAAGPGGGVDMTGIAFDQNGNPTWNGIDAGVLTVPGRQQQDPTQLAGAVGKPGWWKALR
jgi:hypothetical protein